MDKLRPETQNEPMNFVIAGIMIDRRIVPLAPKKSPDALRGTDLSRVIVINERRSLL